MMERPKLRESQHEWSVETCCCCETRLNWIPLDLKKSLLFSEDFWIFTNFYLNIHLNILEHDREFSLVHREEFRRIGEPISCCIDFCRYFVPEFCPSKFKTCFLETYLLSSFHKDSTLIFAADKSFLVNHSGEDKRTRLRAGFRLPHQTADPSVFAVFRYFELTIAQQNGNVADVLSVVFHQDMNNS